MLRGWRIIIIEQPIWHWKSRYFLELWAEALYYAGPRSLWKDWDFKEIVWVRWRGNKESCQLTSFLGVSDIVRRGIDTLVPWDLVSTMSSCSHTQCHDTNRAHASSPMVWGGQQCAFLGCHRSTGDGRGWSRRPPWSVENVMWVVKQRSKTGGQKYRSVRYIFYVTILKNNLRFRTRIKLVTC